jgi:hypothetical protein
VDTAPEPWLLLPLLGMRQKGTYSEYGHKPSRRAIDEFINRIEGGKRGFEEELRQFVIGLYERASDEEARYFLDKTPKYHTIAPKLLDLFADTKAVILWRSPLSIVASMVETWGRGWWNVFKFRLDLYRGLPTLIELAKQRRDSVVTVRYEDLVLERAGAWERVSQHFNLDRDTLERSPPTIDGHMGDPNQEDYSEISAQPIEKWKSTMSNPLRKLWMRRYLHWLGEGRLQVMGYSMKRLEEELDSVPTTGKMLGADLCSMCRGLLHPIIEHHIFRDKIEKESWKDLVSHY